MPREEQDGNFTSVGTTATGIELEGIANDS